MCFQSLVLLNCLGLCTYASGVIAEARGCHGSAKLVFREVYWVYSRSLWLNSWVSMTLDIDFQVSPGL